MTQSHSTRTVNLPRKGEVPITNGYRFRKAAPTRLDRAELLVESGCVHPRGEGVYFVESATERLQGVRGIGYSVDAAAESCQCKDHERGNICQHILAVEVYRERMRASVRPHQPVEAVA